MFFLFFANVENLNSSVKSAISFCVNSLIPSIFIFMVLSSFILYSSAFSDILEGLPNRVFQILGICKRYASYVIFCSLCGFVNGPRLICEDYRKNGGDEDEVSSAVILSSNAGLGFVVGCVGARIWGSALYGAFLYLAQIVSALLLGKILLKGKKSVSEIKKGLQKNARQISLSSAFSKAVSSSASTVISICAFVVVFSALISTLSNVFNIESDSSVSSVIFIFTEFCQGSFLSLSFENVLVCAFFSGFCIGFGGFCVHFQTFAVCEGCPLKKSKFIFFKFIHGIACGLCSLFYVLITDSEPLKNTSLAGVSEGGFEKFSAVFLFACIIFVIIKFLFKNFKRFF